MTETLPSIEFCYERWKTDHSKSAYQFDVYTP
jgi:hypothetical protein